MSTQRIMIALLATLTLGALAATPTTAQAAAKYTFDGHQLAAVPSGLRGTWYAYNQRTHRYDKLIIKKYAITYASKDYHHKFTGKKLVLRTQMSTATSREKPRYSLPTRPNDGAITPVYLIDQVKVKGRSYHALVERQNWLRHGKFTRETRAWTHFKTRHAVIPRYYQTW